MSASPSPRTRSRLPRWLKILTITLLVLANLGVLGFVWAIQTGNTLLSGANVESIDSLDPSRGGQQVFLVVGSDSRDGLDDLTNFGRAGGARSDVVMLVRVEGSGSAQMLSIPRDLRVDIPGHGTNKINASYAFGGPSLLVDTIKSNLNVEVNHYVEVDFVGFMAMIDELGGIEMHFPDAARDSKSGLDLPAGTTMLNGSQALAYARSRSYQENRNGSWVSVDANDIGRTQRQQEVMRALMSRLKSPATITEAGDIADALSRHMTIDASLAGASSASLFWDFRGILTGSVAGATLPTRTQSIGGSSYQIAVEPDASTMLANFRAGTAFADQPLRVEVLNGNGRAGSAGEMSRTLESHGFEVVSIGNADRNSYAQTTIIVSPGSDGGSKITSALGFGVVEFGPVDNRYDAVIIVGLDAS